VKEFLDISDRWSTRKGKTRGLSRPRLSSQYKENGQFFVYYTSTAAPHLSVISRFRVSKDNPNKADPNPKKRLLRIPSRIGNHNGGTIVFGPGRLSLHRPRDGGAFQRPARQTARS